MTPPAADVREHLMLAFRGRTLPPAAAARMAAAPFAGITLYRYHNVDDPAQVLALTAEVQAAAARFDPDAPPVLVAADQEGGQLQGLGDGTTPFPGSMALGATGDPGLAERVGAATGTELRAMGVNVAYAPVCDLATNPANPAIGIRAFGDDPGAAAAMAAAMVRGLRAAGVAATAKHFPGLGEAALDSHHGLPALDHDAARLDATELVAFAAAIGAGADLVMSAHVALPALTGDPALAATLSGAVMRDLLRGRLGFGGVSITDALDMAALPQGAGQAAAVVAALRAGVDLLLCAPDEAAIGRIERGLAEAVHDGALDPAALGESRARIRRLRSRLADRPRPGLEVVGGAPHRALAREVAARSITLVRDRDRLLPLRPAPDDVVLAIMPAPRELTPADTSASVVAGLGAALRRHHGRVDEIVTGHPPTAGDVAGVVARARDAAVVVVGTIAASADPAQARLVEALLGTGRPLVTVALRTPFDLAAYPAAGTHACSYGILEPSLDALADALFGEAPFRGRLPAAIPGIAPRGHAA